MSWDDMKCMNEGEKVMSYLSQDKRKHIKVVLLLPLLLCTPITIK